MTTKEMPRYQCLKIVHALKIKNIVAEATGTPKIFFEEEEYEPISPELDWFTRHKPEVGGYYVVYEDGYKSWSPAEAFENGYHKQYFPLIMQTKNYQNLLSVKVFPENRIIFKNKEIDVFEFSKILESYDKKDETIKVLLESCEILQKRLEFLINMTPSGIERNILTEENIKILGILDNLKEEKILHIKNPATDFYSDFQKNLIKHLSEFKKFFNCSEEDLFVEVHEKLIEKLAGFTKGVFKCGLLYDGDNNLIDITPFNFFSALWLRGVDAKYSEDAEFFEDEIAYYVWDEPKTKLIITSKLEAKL